MLLSAHFPLPDFFETPLRFEADKTTHGVVQGVGSIRSVSAGDGGIENLAKTAMSKPVAESHPGCQIPRRNRGRARSQIRRLIPRRHPKSAIALRHWHQARRQGKHPPVQDRHSSNQKEPRESPGSPRHTYVEASLLIAQPEVWKF
jgi:hypothetical protein